MPCNYLNNNRKKESKMNTYKEKKIWAVLGVSEEAKEMAKKMSKDEKKTIGPWLEQLIINKSKNDPAIKSQLRNIENSVEFLKLELTEQTRTILDRLPKNTIMNRIFK